ncbi:MAG: MBL fold metallo-hydrolase [Gammaproteobacteria bacterium]|nr:MBL fold metallo-hydrolase [Gammaproteobacteria bacterium]
MKIQFLGATETVTGSKYLLTHEGMNILVDCGLFQGRKELRQRNWQKLPIDGKDIHAVILTHAHIDHSGYLPLLVKQGFKGKVYCTEATAELCKILLPDSGHLQEEYAEHVNRNQITSHKPAEPLYTELDAIKSLKNLVPCDFGKKYVLSNNNLSFQFNRAGHILGAAMTLVMFGHKSILFTGDIGRKDDPIMLPPVAVTAADYLVIESTYGDRLHRGPKAKNSIAKIINNTIERKGSVLIPAFAVGRSQMILYYIHELKRDGAIPDVPVYLDSPMAINATEIFHRFVKEHRLTPVQAEAVCSTASYVNSVEESKRLDYDETPKIIISASGMAAGGRVLHHLRVLAPDKANSVMFVGFQADGTLGDALVREKVRKIRLFRDFIPVRAEVHYLNNLSAHADYLELMEWLRNFDKAPSKTFVVHGEAAAAKTFQACIQEKFGWKTSVPSYLQEEELS